jgi:hypothetical protein
MITCGTQVNPYEQLAEELLRGCRVSTALHQDVEHMPLLINSPPEIMARAIDREGRLVQVPRVAGSGTPAPQLMSVRLTKLAAPLAMASYDTITPRANRISSTSRQLRQKRKYSQTPWLMISAGKRWFL